MGTCPTIHSDKTRSTQPDLQNLLLYLPGGDKRKDLTYVWASLVAQIVKNLPALQETQVQSLGLGNHLEEEMATHSSTLAWRIPWTEEPGRATVHGVAKSQTQLSDFHTMKKFQ